MITILLIVYVQENTGRKRKRNMAKRKLTKADKLANASLVISLIGMILDMFIVGIPLSIAGIILAVLSIKDGKYTDYSSYDDGYEEKISHKVRAISGIVLSVIGFGILVAALLNL